MKSTNIIFVHGLFGWGPGDLEGWPYWGEATRQFGNFKVHEARCGPVSSFHDRACEVYAQIKGEPVNYGKAHSDNAGHAQTNNAFAPHTDKPVVAHWSAENPVILIGHSAGAQTCMQLQHLLAERFWDKENNADWIEAIICVAGVINGSMLPYLMGCDKVSGRLNGLREDFIGTQLQMAALSTELLGNDHYHFYLEQWQDKPAKNPLLAIFDRLPHRRFVDGEDNLAFDLTVQGCRLANQKFKTHGNTYYLSVVTSQTGALRYDGHQFAKLLMNPLLQASANYQGADLQFDPEHPPIPEWGTGNFTPELWRENDGAVSSISQQYPFTGAHLPGKEGFLGGEALERGQWYFEDAEKSTGHKFDHLDVVFCYESELLSGKNAHIKLYQQLYARLCSLA